MNYLIKQLRADEGVRRQAYDDATGVTIRPGHTLQGHATIGVGFMIDGTSVGLYDNEIDFILENRIKIYKEELLRVFPWMKKLDAPRMEVFQNMHYNLGLRSFSSFTDTLAAAEAGDWKATKDGMLDSAWARTVKDRAHRLAEQMETGIRWIPPS